MKTTQSFCQPLLFLNFLSRYPESWFLTAALWSALDTLVLRYQHTCTVVLPRGWPCASKEPWVPRTSSSDSGSRETSSEDPGEKQPSAQGHGPPCARRREGHRAPAKGGQRAEPRSAFARRARGPPPTPTAGHSPEHSWGRSTWA